MIRKRIMVENDFWSPETTHLYFYNSSNNSNIFSFSGSGIYYSLDLGNTWTSLTAGRTVTVGRYELISWKGQITPSTSSPYGIGRFSSTGSFYVGGNPMSLLFGDDFKGKKSLYGYDWAFYSLFEGCTYLNTKQNHNTSIQTLECAFVLPATTLSERCYSRMFVGCTALDLPPELPATTLANYCYSNMFQGCSSLEVSPVLPATTLATGCYGNMFNGTNTLPDCTYIDFTSATVVQSGGLNGLFWGTKVTDNDLFNILPINPNTNKYYLPVTSLSQNCYAGMFLNCEYLETAPELPATTLAQNCYREMFRDCTSLTTAPELPATTLVNYCYYSMFSDCSLLDYIKCLATDISATNCTNNWLKNVSSTGTFVKDPNMASWTTGIHGIPTGWIVTSDYKSKYLTIRSLADNNTIGWKASNSLLTMTISVSTDNGTTWTNKTSSTSGTTLATLSTDATLLIKGTNTAYGTSSYYNYFTSTQNFEVEGNIMSLIYGDNFVGQTILDSSGYNFKYLFYNCTKLISAENLILPATTLANNCYQSMFYSCPLLTTAPELPATTLANYCYNQMFSGCASLTTAPELPATTLSSYCYQNMFQYCISLNYIKCLATNISATSCTNNWVNMVASSGLFIKAPTMSNWTIGDAGIPTGWITQSMGMKNYLMFTATQSGTFTFTMPAAVDTTYMTSVSYSTDGINWTTTNNSSSDVTITTPTIAAGKFVLWKGIGKQISKSNENPTEISKFSSTGTFKASGNVMSMLYGDDFENRTEFPNGSTYSLGHLFSECSNLTEITYLELPATTLTDYCYAYMFEYNTAITSVPANLLPATTLATYCCQGMFYGCTGLTSIPSGLLPSTTLTTYCYNNMFRLAGLTSLPNNLLPATTLESYCYSYMFAETSITSIPSGFLPATTLASDCYQDTFYNCRSLTTVPSNLLPATTLEVECYRAMFNGCSGLTTAPNLPATTLANYCYYSMFYGCSSLTTIPSTLPATALKDHCYRSMFYNCTSLITVPTLPATTLKTYCYAYMFRGCSKITTAPVLSAKTLISYCYHQMFYGCSKLNYIKAMFTTKPTTSYTNSWVNGVASSGTFVKNSSATWSVTGTSGVPSGWTVQTASS